MLDYLALILCSMNRNYFILIIANQEQTSNIQPGLLSGIWYQQSAIWHPLSGIALS